MLVARFEKDDQKKMLTLRVKGHANAGNVGYDIICSAASILACTLGQQIKFAEVDGKLKYNPKIKLKEGDSLISCRAKDDAWAEILLYFAEIQTGFFLLAHNYPQYVAVEMLGSEDYDEGSES